MLIVMGHLARTEGRTAPEGMALLHTDHITMP